MFLEHSQQGKHPIEEGTGVGNEQLHRVHGEDTDKEFGGGVTAPGNDHEGENSPNNASAHKHTRYTINNRWWEGS